MPTCLEYRPVRVKKCQEYRDDGYWGCQTYQDQGNKSCSDWDKNCCDWIPCKWVCKVFTWICVAWVWISNWVCIAWFWVSNIACAVWAWITQFICVLWDVLTTVANAVVETVESVFGWVLDGVASIISFLFSLPVIGGIVKWVWNLVVSVVWGIAGLADAALGLLGIMPEKKLRLCSIILCDENSSVVDHIDSVVFQIQRAIDIYREQANVRIVPLRPFYYVTPFADSDKANQDWIRTYCPGGGNPTSALDANCGTLKSVGKDVGVVGSLYQMILTTSCYSGNFRRMIGYGAPVTALIVRNISGDSFGDKLGCANPLDDYVLVASVEAQVAQQLASVSSATKALADADRFADLELQRRTLAHELGHACYLTHISAVDNLMDPNSTDSLGQPGEELSYWQAIVVRSSRHVTYF